MPQHQSETGSVVNRAHLKNEAKTENATSLQYHGNVNTKIIAVFLQ